MSDQLTVEHPDRSLTVEKPEWDWVFIRRALHEQGRYQRAQGNNDRSADLYELSTELVEPYPDVSFTLSEWVSIVTAIDDYSTHLRLGFSESIAEEYMNYVDELKSHIRLRDRE